MQVDFSRPGPTGRKNQASDLHSQNVEARLTRLASISSTRDIRLGHVPARCAWAISSAVKGRRRRRVAELRANQIGCRLRWCRQRRWQKSATACSCRCFSRQQPTLDVISPDGWLQGPKQPESRKREVLWAEIRISGAEAWSPCWQTCRVDIVLAANPILLSMGVRPDWPP